MIGWHKLLLVLRKDVKLEVILIYLTFLQLDLYLLSQKWKELVEKARAKQLQPHEYNSGYYYY